MKNKKYILTAVAAASLLLGASSCSDSFLDENPMSSYVPGGVTNDKTIEANLKGIYYIYGQLWGWSGRQGFLSCWHIGTDVASASATEGVEVPFYQYGELNEENAGVNYMWEKQYEMINAANNIIAALGEETANKAGLAEAKFFRGYAYNILVTLWGKVPLITEPTTAPRTDYIRDEIEKIDAQIESDLKYACENMLEVDATASESRVNRYVAMQALGEAYLRMGMRDSKYFAMAENVLSSVIGSGKYSLIKQRYGSTSQGGDYYSDMFKWGKQRRSQGNTEGIWTYEMEYGRDVTGGTIDNPQHRRVWVPAFHKRDGMVNADSLGGRGNGRLRLSNWVKYSLYQEGDIRNSNYNIRRVLYYNRPDWSGTIQLDNRGFQYDEADKFSKESGKGPLLSVKTGDRFIPFANDSIEVFGPYTTKWGCYDVTDDFGYACVKDWPVMRLGETYLLRAEARFRQGNLAGAAEDINVLRDRAFLESRQKTGNPNLGKVFASDITLDFILDERARELVAEENRRMTLVRTNTLLERAKLNVDEAKPITGLAEHNLLLPIPLNDIQLNKDAKLEQNPGYE